MKRKREISLRKEIELDSKRLICTAPMVEYNLRKSSPNNDSHVLVEK